jgi:hypothetical protein
MNAKPFALSTACALLVTAAATAQDMGSAPPVKTVGEPTTEDSCPADFDGNGGVNFGDLLWVINHWGPCDTLGPGPSTGNCEGDLDDDGLIGFAEFLEVMSNFNRACPDVFGGNEGGPSTEPAP